jgi:hypothetical protein
LMMEKAGGMCGMSGQEGLGEDGSIVAGEVHREDQVRAYEECEGQSAWGRVPSRLLMTVGWGGCWAGAAVWGYAPVL